MTVPIIKHISAINFLDELNTEGNSPIKVIGSDYNFYLVKNSRNKKPATDMINEVLAHYFLRLWNIPTPDIALISVNPDHLLDRYSNYHSPQYYRHEVFGSQWLDNTFDSSEILEVKGKLDYNKFMNPEILFLIGLFDMWIENDDRKPSNHNLLVQSVKGKHKFFAIDHSFIFASISYNDLKPLPFYPKANDEIFESKLVSSLLHYKRKDDKWLPINKDSFYLCVDNCKREYGNIVDNIPEEWSFTEENKENLYNFLFNKERLKEVYKEFGYKMQQ